MIQPRPGSMMNYDAADGGVLPEFDRAAVAELTIKEISEMPREKLMQALEEVPVLYTYQPERLPYFDRPVLERLLHLTRRCCRNLGY